MLLLVWLLRSGSMTASATGDRQRIRGGTKWYDVVVAPLSAPWHLLRAIPTTVAAVFWAGGFAVAAWLLCYAFSVELHAQPVRQRGRPGRRALPRSGRLARAPTAVTVGHPAQPDPSVWVLALAALLLLALVLGLVAEAGVHWAPATGQPAAEPGFARLPAASGHAWHDGLVQQYRIIIT